VTAVLGSIALYLVVGVIFGIVIEKGSAIPYLFGGEATKTKLSSVEWLLVISVWPIILIGATGGLIIMLLLGG